MVFRWCQKTCLCQRDKDSQSRLVERAKRKLMMMMVRRRVEGKSNRVLELSQKIREEPSLILAEEILFSYFSCDKAINIETMEKSKYYKLQHASGVVFFASIK